MAPRLSDLFRRLTGGSPDEPVEGHDLIAPEAADGPQQPPEAGEDVVVASVSSDPQAGDDVWDSVTAIYGVAGEDRAAELTGGEGSAGIADGTSNTVFFSESRDEESPPIPTPQPNVGMTRPREPEATHNDIAMDVYTTAGEAVPADDAGDTAQPYIAGRVPNPPAPGENIALERGVTHDAQEEPPTGATGDMPTETMSLNFEEIKSDEGEAPRVAAAEGQFSESNLDFVQRHLEDRAESQGSGVGGGSNEIRLEDSRTDTHHTPEWTARSESDPGLPAGPDGTSSMTLTGVAPDAADHRDEIDIESWSWGETQSGISDDDEQDGPPESLAGEGESEPGLTYKEANFYWNAFGGAEPGAGGQPADSLAGEAEDGRLDGTVETGWDIQRNEETAPPPNDPALAAGAGTDPAAAPGSGENSSSWIRVSQMHDSDGTSSITVPDGLSSESETIETGPDDAADDTGDLASTEPGLVELDSGGRWWNSRASIVNVGTSDDEPSAPADIAQREGEPGDSSAIDEPRADGAPDAIAPAEPGTEDDQPIDALLVRDILHPAQSASEEEKYLQVELKDALVSSYQTGGSDDEPSTLVDFAQEDRRTPAMAEPASADPDLEPADLEELHEPEV